MYIVLLPILKTVPYLDLKKDVLYSYIYTTLFLSGSVSFCILRFHYELKYIWYLILINSPMQLLWQTGSETVFGP